MKNSVDPDRLAYFIKKTTDLDLDFLKVYVDVEFQPSIQGLIDMNPYYSSCFINVLFANGMVLSKLHKRATENGKIIMIKALF